jgi:hypothetical protein
VVRPEQGAVLLLETNFRATKRFSNNSRKRLTAKVLSCDGRERNFRD